MSGVVVYRSTYGSAKQYADWIHEETGFPVYESRDKKIPWAGADTIVIGCPILANKPVLTGWIAKHWDRMKGKHVALFTTSGSSGDTYHICDPGFDCALDSSGIMNKATRNS